MLRKLLNFCAGFNNQASFDEMFVFLDFLPNEVLPRASTCTFNLLLLWSVPERRNSSKWWVSSLILKVKDLEIFNSYFETYIVNIQSSEAATRGVCSRLRSSRPDVFWEKYVLRNFTKFTGKHLCQSLFFNKVAGGACNFIRKETLAQVLSYEFREISKNTFFSEHIWATAS